ncbi:MAG: hypothetical protein CVV27_19980, partial [Candidatus Melainabacteria bacterium HGW-Melainabacteria-1]
LSGGNWNLVALSRNPDGRPAKELRQRGIEVHQADLENSQDLMAAFKGAYGVYGVTTPMTAKGKLDMQMEQRQGINIADACLANQVAHLVMSTAFYIDKAQEVVPYIHSKREIERYIAAKEIPYTILQPASFMDEIGGEFMPVKNGVVTGQADDDAKVPYIACQDIGEYARLAFENPDKFIGQKLNLVAELVSGNELAETLTKVNNGQRFRHKAPPIWLMWIFAREWITLRKQFESWGRPPHPEVMLQALESSHQLHPELLTFEQYLRNTGFSSAKRSS